MTGQTWRLRAILSPRFIRTSVDVFSSAVLQNRDPCSSSNAVFFMFNGVLNFSPLGLVIVGLSLTHVTIAAVTIFLHRCQAHRALYLHPVASHFFRFWLWLTTGMVTREWVAVHRKHHAKCETPEDPHSPQVYGIGKVLLEGAELYDLQAKDEKTLEKYGRGVPDDWLERKLYSRFSGLGIAIMLLIDLVLFGALGLTLWAAQMLWIPFWAAGVINGLGHHSGYRRFETQDASTNLFPFAILVGGEELHNNHHAYPSSAKLSSQWWEFDIGWLYIRLMEMLKLARVNRAAPIIRIEKNRSVGDRETLAAVLQSRFHVMALYGRDVIRPILRLESRMADRQARKLLAQAAPWLLREYPRQDETARAMLRNALEACQTLATAYRFKEQLRELWTNASMNREMRLDALRDWLDRAAAAEVQGLRDFAERLRGYTLLPVVCG
jgi:stearoyl-CoA desaturase (delta-9 desaturase)